ncbi:MAG: tetratricopeptide repeat protein, partial [Candidatus Acidiferrales bacterium]
TGILVVAISVWLYHGRRAHALGPTDTILLADFANSTGDSVFDDALRQGLAVQLEQSPFLNLVSEQRIQHTLQMMNQSPEARLTPETALDLCVRAGSAAVLNGSIAQIGTRYTLFVKAVNCSSGETLASSESEADDRNQVLDALGKVATDMRAKLGESLSTIRKLDAPLEQATTPSLEALQAYSLGRKNMTGKVDYAGTIPFFQRAIQLDPNFAMAYAALGTSYNDLGQTSLAARNNQKSYDLRERVSEREKLYIETHYYQLVSGELQKASQAYELWAQLYPRDSIPRGNLANLYASLGQYEKALERAREALDLSPDAYTYTTIVFVYTCLNHLDDADATAKIALMKYPDSPYLRINLYQIAFLRSDPSAMAAQVAWSTGKPGVEDVMLSNEADTAAYSGRLAKARELSRQAIALALHADQKETAAAYESDSALREAFFGNSSAARDRVATVLTLSNGRDVQYAAALALAIAGDSARAIMLADDLAKRFPSDTLVQLIYLPTVRAQLALGRGAPATASAADSARGIMLLQAVSPYEMGFGSGNLSTGLYPSYVRGQIYLAARQGREAASEFQRIIDHRSIVFNAPIGALAHLGLARAYALQGDATNSRAAYNDFFTLWKEADPNIPILLAAKSEAAKLH